MSVTLVITSCNRQDLLETTLKSFFKFNTYKIEKIIIIEDSGIQGCIDEAIKNIPENIEKKIIYNETNIGQIKSIDIAYSYVETEYIFHCEDDWEFYDYGFIEISLDIIEQDKNIMCVWLREYKNFSVIRNGHRINEKIINNKYRLLGTIGVWRGFTFNPALRRKKDYDIVKPYAKLDENCKYGGNVEKKLQIVYDKLNKIYAISLKESGYVKHIGWNCLTKRD